LGNAYVSLATIDNAKANLGYAVDAFNEALKIRTATSHRTDYAKTLAGLGVAYRRLSEVDDRETNLATAVNYLTRAEKFFKWPKVQKENPTTYWNVEDNLGAVYNHLAEIRDKQGNVEKAMTAFKEAFRVLCENGPNKSDAKEDADKHRRGDAKDDADQRARGAAQDAGRHSRRGATDAPDRRLQEGPAKDLEECATQNFPIQSATTLRHTGNTYILIAGLGDKVKNLNAATQHYEEASAAHQSEEFPTDAAKLHFNWGNAQAELAEVNGNEKNLQRAIEEYKIALSVPELSASPYDHARTLVRLGAAYHKLAGAAGAARRKDNLENARTACNEALELYTQAGYPEDSKSVQASLDRWNKELAALPQ
jgi:tetratricopeptide (TPR) repeat protein